MNPLVLWDELPEFRSLKDSITKGWHIQVYGLEESGRTFLVAGVASRMGRPVFLITPDLSRAERLQRDLITWLGTRDVLVLPPVDLMPYAVLAHSRDLVAARIHALHRLLTDPPAAVVCPVASLLREVMPADLFRKLPFSLRVGEMVDFSDLVRRIAGLGYQRTELVEGVGSFAVRGGIIDLYPPGFERPLRVEFFGDEVSSIRLFDPDDQRSVASRTQVSVPPAREFLFPPEAVPEGVRAIRRQLESQLTRLASLGQRSVVERLKSKVEEHLASLEAGEVFEGMEQYAPYFYPSMASVLEYLPENSVVFVDEPGRTFEAGRAAEDDLRERVQAWLEQGSFLPGQADAYRSFAAARRPLLRRPTVYLSTLLTQVPDASPRALFSLSMRPVPSFQGQWEVLAEEVRTWKRRGHRTIFLTPSEDRAKRLAEVLGDRGIDVVCTREWRLSAPGTVLIADGSIGKGFEFPALGIVVLGDGELTGSRRLTRKRHEARDDARRLLSYEELEPGDYVVHVHHGIGRYLGIKTLEVDGAQKDYLFLKYAKDDRLYVPVDQIELIQKYVGVDGKEPKLSKLGGSEWSKVKRRVKESVREMAEELLRLYATRERIQGHSFSEDTPWQREFEDAFPYEETEDQIKATAEIKADMERPRPMDRLLCGDVGYGKTEVALRAAFKAIMDGKQVAFLVPTTILAQQHYHTFQERFRGYPIVVEMLSRFRSRSEVKTILEKTRRGEVDLLVGTHRLLQEDVAFKDLGLLIVDEEQRFGVAHKERLKQLKTSVDVLTLTATPIPRTLHMALVGLRDMSMIETPPADRYPVQTYVVEYGPALIREAIQRELDRGGQVYYVYNRVQGIDAVYRRLSMLLPDARIAVAHGQMPEGLLERVMLDFLAGEYDVLLCTTIVESGLDIANVNTLVVEDADQFGLSQLYQLRGRVGRSDRLAFAYFTYRRDKVLSEAAQKRLKAIREFTEFGAGFRIALRDLEIRGAGNILGPEQHGFIISVGFDLYCQLLEDAVRELKGEAPRDEAPPTLEIGIDAYLPSDYVRDEGQRIQLYKRINSISSPEELLELREEIVDRFGPLPPPAKTLMALAKLRLFAVRCGISSVLRRNGQFVIKFRDAGRIDLEELVRMAQRNPDKVRLMPGDDPSLVYRVNSQGVRAVEEVTAFLRSVQGIGLGVAGPSDARINE